MLNPSVFRRRHTILLLFWLTLAAALIAGTSPSARAADEIDQTATGTASVTLGTGKSGKALKKQRIVLRRVTPATVKRLTGKRFRAELPADQLTLASATLSLKGGFLFTRGRRSVKFAQPLVKAVKTGTVLTARVGGKRIALFRSSKKMEVERAWLELKWHAVAELKQAPLKLTPAAARTLRGKLKVKRLPAGPVGRASLAATRLDEPPTPPVVDLGDPYMTQCKIAATSIGSGEFPAAPDLPELDDPEPALADGPAFDWGVRESLRNYLRMFGGTMHALDGASLIGEQPNGLLTNVNFVLPVTGGGYSPSTDKAVLETSGTGLFCNKAHSFRVAYSNVTVVIDGGNSRIDADVDMNKYGTWTKTQRITVATLDPTGITPETSGDGTEVTWSQIPGAFTDAGARLFCAEGGPPGTPNICVYNGPSGDNGADYIDPIDLTLKIAATEGP